MRIFHTALRRHSASARVYISIDQQWNGTSDPNPLRACPGHALVDEFNRLSKERGDFDWHIAQHPYPGNFFNTSIWIEPDATSDSETRLITFKNLEVLTAYLERPEMRYNGQKRRIILSEQGFHSDGTPEGELLQAAAFAYAYYKTNNLDGIDAFILHRHVDHGNEFGLSLGLWTTQTGALNTADRKKVIYDIFQMADTPEWEVAFAFALPIIGIKDWCEILPDAHTPSTA